MSSIIKAAIAGAITAGMFMAGTATAADGNWLVRGRIVSMTNDNSNENNLLGAEVTASDKVLPDLDISYFFTENIALEVVLSIPQTHDIELGGTKIGEVTQLPPHFMLQYHFPMGAFKPYVGAGINYTRFWDVKLIVPGVDIERSSWGGSLQVGMDYELSKQWYLNADVKKTWIATDVKAGDTVVDTLHIDPWLIGVGVGYRF
ncbi:OmpW family protein [Niveibacterium umoris]|uniref:Outer membrane protein n=1 Tax=Niveibacterium umoris TaxID=1193620 RepID=A0A840BUH3_9RHOO|nr:OmpW family outer membrane protein [Niveibacterium umoris]MBB4014007.1 outer membrane protein [Niveibacterium umoris]